MNEICARIMDTKCNVCGAKIIRDVYTPPFGIGKSVIKWKCNNDKCEEAYWHLPRK